MNVKRLCGKINKQLSKETKEEVEVIHISQDPVMLVSYLSVQYTSSGVRNFFVIEVQDSALTNIKILVTLILEKLKIAKKLK